MPMDSSPQGGASTGSVLFEKGPTPVAAVNTSGIITAWNAAAERMYGIPASDALGVPFIDRLIDEDDAMDVRRAFHDAASLSRSTAPRETTCRLRCADGTIRFVNMTILADRLADQPCLLIVMENQPHRPMGQPLADDAVPPADLPCRVLPVRLAAYDTSARFLMITPGMEPDAELRTWIIGKTDQEYGLRRKLDPAIALRHLHAIHHVVQDGEPLLFGETMPGQDGEPREMIRFIVPIRVLSGVIRFVLAYDIELGSATTDRKTLLPLSSGFATLLEHLHDGVVMEDGEQRILTLNRRCSSLFSLAQPPEVWTGQEAAQFSAAIASQFLKPAVFLATTETCRQRKSPCFGELLALSDGRMVERDYLPLTIDGVNGGHIWLYRDVSPRRLAESGILATLAEDGNTRLEVALRSDMIHRMTEYGARLVASRSVEDIAHAAESLLEDLTDVEYSGIFLVDPSTGRLRLLFARGFSDDERAAAERTAMERHPGWVLRHGHMLNIPDVECDPAQRSQSSPRSFTVRSRLFVPVHNGEECVGTFGLASSHPHRFGETEIALLSFGATVAGVKYGTLMHDLERARVDLELRLRNSAILSSNNGIMITDARNPDHPILFVNPAFERQTGYPAAEILGRSPRFLRDPSFNQPALTVLRQALHDARECTVVLQNMTREGRRFWAEICISPIFSADGEPTHFISIQNDVTERIRVQEELTVARDQAVAADRAKSEFLANTSHEIRTPLNGIIAAAELLRSTDLAPRQQPYLDAISHCGNRLNEIISDLLDLSMIEAGTMELWIQPFDPGSTFDGIFPQMQAEAAAKGLTLLVNIDTPLPGIFVSDETRIRQILVNLLSNAVKFTTEGSIAVHVRFSGDEQGAGRLDVSIADTGIGMSKEFVARVGTSFSQEDASSTRQYKGTGLGLAITCRLIAMLGGEYTIESSAGVGTTFSFFLPELPRQAPRLDPVAGTTVPRLRRRRAIDQMRILLVEDDVLIRNLLVHMLDQLGAHPDIAENGSQAVAACKALSYDLVLMDLHMPQMDGFEAIRTIRTIIPEESQPYCVAISAGVVARDRDKAIDAGMDDFLRKPIRSADLRRALEGVAILPDPVEREAAQFPAAAAAEVADAVDAFIDREMIGSLMSADAGDEALFPQLVALLDEQAAVTFHTIDVALLDHDAETIEATAHRFAGSSATLGLVKVSRLCKDIEERATTATFDELEGMIAILRTTFEVSRKML
jgi:PAS domain S-box-containing protein